MAATATSPLATMVSSRQKSAATSLWLSFLLLLVVRSSSAFSSPRAVSRLYSSSNSQDDDWLYGGDDNTESSPLNNNGMSPPPSSVGGRSYMPQYIDAFLEKERQKRGEGEATTSAGIYTHMIGIPMMECHELQIELESVQRAILYHCPSLVHACIVPSLSRLPLLYVDASREPAGRVTMELTEIVERMVQQHCFTLSNEPDNQNDVASAANGNDLDANSYSGANDEGYKPLTMTFSGLEIDGEDNEVLLTVADKKDTGGGLKRLQGMVQDIQDEIEAKGYKTMYPPSDDVQGMLSQENPRSLDDFAPRIPFMRLPSNFESLLRPLEDNNKDFHSTNDGGNGISPIFWIKWENDVMGRNVRLREIAIYPRRPGMSGLDELTFYVPHETVPLPGGNEALSMQEQIHQQYNEERMKESERQLLDDDDDDNNNEGLSPDGTFKDPSLSDNRKILEAIFGKESTVLDDGIVMPEEGMELQAEGSNAAESLDDWRQDRINAIIDDNDEGKTKKSTAKTVESDSTPTEEDVKTSNTPPLDDWMQDRIRKIVENRPSQQNKVPKKKNVPKLEENPVFQAYREGSLVQKPNDLNTSSESDLDLFPSKESLRGFWKTVRSPLSSSSSSMNDMSKPADDSQSDNFILRVDGTVAGGPMLDSEMQQKASGGTWSMLEEETADDDDEENVRLRIRLVIPPKKDRIMVWEGKLYMESESLSNAASILEATSFGKVKSATNTKVIKCRGSVWIEDAITKKNREDLGSFVLTKVKTSSNPKDYTITIPKSIRNQD